jgi:two-component system, NtrC family, nitrogen regulation sensor histidine kinase NtrY
MFSFFRQYFFLFLAFVLFALSLVNNFWADDKTKAVFENKYQESVQQNINKEITASTLDLANIITNVKQTINPHFESFIVTTTYPYLIFENNKPIFWSSNQPLPSYKELQNLKNNQFLETPTGSFIVNKNIVSKNKHLYEIYSIITLNRNFQNQNEYLQSKYNEDIFLSNPLSIGFSKTQVTQKPIRGFNKSTLFYIEPPFTRMLQKRSSTESGVIFLCLGFLFLGIFCFQIAQRFYFQNKIWHTYIVAFLYFLVVRVFMLYYSIPFLFTENNAFNPKYFVQSQYNPSIGDLFINIVLLLVFIVLVLQTYSKFYFFRNLLKLNTFTKYLFGFLAVLCSYLFLCLYVEIVASFYKQPQHLFDLGLNNNLDTFKIIAILIYIALSISFFCVNHLLINIFVRFTKPYTLHLFFGASIVGLMFVFYRYGFSLILFVLPIYWLVVIGTKFYRLLGNFSYKTTIYLFTAAFLCAGLTFIIHIKELNILSFDEKSTIAERYLAENDLLTEGLLSKSILNIASDSTISRAIQNQVFAREKVKQIILEKHLDTYLESYDTEVHLFDETGITFDNTLDAKNFEYYEENYKKASNATQIEGVYFINEPDKELSKQYLSFIPIVSQNRIIGNVVLDMKMEGDGSQGFYPELLKNRKNFQDIDSRDYSYAIFQNGVLKQNLGIFNYQKKFSKSNLTLEKLFRSGIKESDFMHVGLKNKKGRTILVSSKARTNQQNLADFSFQYMILIICVILFTIGYAFRFGFKNINISFATRIQIYLNIAFLLPLLLVILITLSVVSSTFIANQGQSYLENTQNISQNIKPSLLKFNQGLISIGVLNQDLNRTAREAKVDINLFDTNGSLISSTKPLIFENNLLSKQINPDAFLRIIDEKENEVLATENIGSLKFNTAFVGINEKTNQTAGIISIPFFNSQSNLDSQITNVISSILSVFTLIFITLLIISYFASNALTVPLRLITQKIKKINLEKPNDPLVWKNKDEIGLLMGEYNKMLLKLDESKEALALSEKQNAWREMAKQVAHEIKNPLTPMKLSVQQLQRTLTITEDLKTKDRIERALNSLIEQIDNISDIAQSFSDFAKMPVPRQEMFDLTNVLQKCADLYADDTKLSLNSYIRLDNAMVLGDRQLMSRIITNLIINGIQSVPASRKPIINLRLYKSDTEDKVIVEVQDNGGGIPESLRQKIFVPNFSTKAGGSGLGLAMAKRGIEHANGNLWFESITGKGSTFFLDLPMDKNITPE